jgi:DNA (cytosine-5)-methyltransferase 1
MSAPALPLQKSLEKENYKLKNVLGPRLRLPAHRESCAIGDLSRYHRQYSSHPLAIDLFSGAGGLSLGLKRAGFKLLLAIDQNAHAVETHSAYFPGASIKADISTEEALDKLLEPLRGKRIDLLAGGPPANLSPSLRVGSARRTARAVARFVTTGGTCGARSYTPPRF